MIDEPATAEAVTTAIEQLRDLAGPLLTAMERSGMPVVVTNPRLPDNPVVFVNHAFVALTGYTAAETLGRNCRFLQGPGTDPATVARIGEAIRGRQPVDTDVLNYTKQGKPFWNRLCITPVPAEAERPDFLLATQMDITPAREARRTEMLIESRERALDEANERLRIALSMAGAVAAWDWHIPERRIVGDASFAALYGLTLERAAEGVGPNTFFSIIHPEDQTRIRLAVGGMLRGAEVFSKEYRILLANGTMRWVHAHGRSQYGDLDQPIRFSGVLTDITEQKRVEEQLRIAQKAGGIGTFEHIHGFGTVTVSAQFCRLLGLHPADDLPVATINGLVHPQDPPIIDLAGNPPPGIARHGEFRITRPDNGEERWLTCRGEHVRDAETAGVRFSGVIYDITEAKRTEEQLRTLNETLETRVEERTRERDRIWQVSRDLYVLCDSDGTCKSTNPAWHSELGYAKGEMNGRRLGEFVHPDDRSVMEAAIGRLARGDYVENIDVRMLRQNGAPGTFSWTAVPEGDVFFAAGRDVTRRAELEEQLRQSQKMDAVGQLTGGIAHDFNNLLTGISGSLEMLQLRLRQGRPADVERYVTAATASANRAAALTHRLLAFSRRQPLDPKSVSANRLVASMEDMVRRTLGETIGIEMLLAGGLWATLCDPNQLENALLNLAINARDAMPKGGTLTVQTCNTQLDGVEPARAGEVKPGQYVCIEVTDTGSGMPAEVMARAFEPFFTTKPIGQGTGLGLSMIYGFIRQSGGHVTIESQVGQGTSVKLYLPRHRGEEREVEDGATGLTEAHEAEVGEVVLVVEDEKAVRDLVVEVLSDLGYTALQATDGPAGLAILRTGARVDLLVTDVGLPGLNGHELAAAARAARPALKILFMTGYAENTALHGAVLDPGMEMITKPFAIEVLASRIRYLMSMRED